MPTAMGRASCSSTSSAGDPCCQLLAKPNSSPAVASTCVAVQLTACAPPQAALAPEHGTCASLRT